jgi:hypothetical protein
MRRKPHLQSVCYHTRYERLDSIVLFIFILKEWQKIQTGLRFDSVN